MTESKFCHSESSSIRETSGQTFLCLMWRNNRHRINIWPILASIDSGTGMMVAWKQRQLNYEWTRNQMTKDQEQIQQQGIQN